MTREELEEKLKMAGVPDYVYNLTGKGRKDECLCIEKNQDKWFVYYLERGIRTTNGWCSRFLIRERKRKRHVIFVFRGTIFVLLD